jgi:hypothetical protein
MKNIILILISAVSILAAEIETPTYDDVHADIKPDSYITLYGTTADLIGVMEDWPTPTEIEIEYSTVTNLTWNVGTSNLIRLAPSLQVVTNWVAIERLTNAPPSTNAGTVTVRQIGQIQTNQILTLIYQNRTNRLLIGSIGKEEWPSQKRTTTESIRRQTMPARK